VRTRAARGFAYAVGVYVVQADAVLLVWHGQLDRWVPVGGRVEVERDEVPHAAAMRETMEEVGLDIRLVEGGNVATSDPDVIIPPQPVQVQEIRLQTGERFLDFVYFATTVDRSVSLDYREARGYHWFTAADLNRFPVPPHVRAYGYAALRELGR
jgi:8-oxo-dGTP pyrophosphatase MutT (NUDIX family)